MTQTVFIEQDLLLARAGTSGTEMPKVTTKLQQWFRPYFAFYSSGSSPAALSSPTLRFVVKLTPTGDPFIFSSTFDTETSAGYTRYFFTITSVDAAALRTALGDLDKLECTGEIEWTVAGVVSRVAFPVLIANANLRSTDGPPNPTDDASDAFVRARAVVFDDEQTLSGAQRWQALANLGITFANGSLRIVLENGDIAHLALTSGEPSAP